MALDLHKTTGDSFSAEELNQIVAEINNKAKITPLPLAEYRALETKDPLTLYACIDEAKKGITRAFIGTYELLFCGSGGGEEPVDPEVKTHLIEISVNPTDLPRLNRIEATGSVLEVVVAPDKSRYTFKCLDKGNVTISVYPIAGSRIKQLNIDSVSQGVVDSYTFSNITAPHTGYVWMEEIPVVAEPLEYLRSDTETTYNTLEAALLSVIADFPNGLEHDLSIRCTKEGVDYRGSDLYNVKITGWANNTLYVLTLDGNNLATLDGRGFGGIYIEEASNIVIRNFTFQNVFTLEGIYKPEETACVYATNITRSHPCRNLYIENCTVNGQSTISPTSNYRTRSAFSAKAYENVSIVNCVIREVSVTAINITDVNLFALIKCTLGGNMTTGIVGHPYLTSFSNVKELRIEDCTIHGNTYNEALITVSNVVNLFLLRNKIRGAKGPVMTAESLVPTNSIVIEYNDMQDNLLLPLFSWECNWFSLPSAKTLRIANNLIVFSSSYYQEYFLRCNDSAYQTLIHVNNIYIRKNNNVNGIILIGGATEKIISNNLYKLTSTFFLSDDTVTSAEGRNLQKLKDRGLETDSAQIPQNTNILISETGGSRNCLTQIYAAAHKARPDYVSEFDGVYKTNNPQETSVGAENYYAVTFDEAGDRTAGYDGLDLTDAKPFNHLSPYPMSAGNTLVLRHRTKQRTRFIRFSVQNFDTEVVEQLFLGKYVLISLTPYVDENGEFVSDKQYNIKID